VEKLLENHPQIEVCAQRSATVTWQTLQVNAAVREILLATERVSKGHRSVGYGGGSRSAATWSE